MTRSGAAQGLAGSPWSRCTNSFTYSFIHSLTHSLTRSGAAQGLAEVVGGLGVDKMHKLMPEIIATAERLDIAPHVKVRFFLYGSGA